MVIKKLFSIVLALGMVVGMLPVSVFATDGTATTTASVNVAKVGNTEYATIDEAIAAWTNSTTLTLLNNVTLSDLFTFPSTESRILQLGTYTMTAASGKHAIEIICKGQRTATYGLKVYADAVNPGGITATGKSCIYTENQTLPKTE